jgi:hypothetical protein
VNRLNEETQVLAEDPLVKEISLIVAKELIQRGGLAGLVRKQ